VKRLPPYIFLAALVLAGCWEKQDNEVLAPEPALYSFDGTVADLADGTALSDIQIVMEEIELNEISLDPSISFGVKSAVSDAQGRFHFDSVFVGRYILTFTRDSFVVLQRNYLQSYTARDELFELPRVFSTGMLWKRDDNPLISLHPEDSLGLSMSLEDQTITFYAKRNNSWIFSNRISNPVTNSFDVEIGNDDHEVWMISNDQGRQQIHRLTYSPDTGWQSISVVTEEPENLVPVALSVKGSTLLASTLTTLYNYSTDTFELLNEISIPEGIYITSIEQQQDRIWLFDKNSRYLYECTKDLLIHGVYLVIINGEKLQVNDFLLPQSETNYQPLHKRIRKSNVSFPHILNGAKPE